MPVVLHLNSFLSLTISPYENEKIEQGIKDTMLHLDANPLYWLSWYHEDTKTVSRSSMPFNFVLTLACLMRQTFLKVPRWNLRALIYQEQSRSVYWMTLAIWPRLENGLHLWPSICYRVRRGLTVKSSRTITWSTYDQNHHVQTRASLNYCTISIGSAVTRHRLSGCGRSWTPVKIASY